MEKQGKENCNNNSVKDLKKTEQLNSDDACTIEISNSSDIDTTLASIHDDVSSSTSREPLPSSVATTIDTSDKVGELEVSIQANNLSNASSIQILSDRMTASAKVRIQHDQQPIDKMQDIEEEIQNVNEDLDKKINMLQGKIQSISDKIKLYEVETVKLQKSFKQVENLNYQGTCTVDENQTIPKTTFDNI
ncbi:unnamed protein product [Mytilus coruscus]|uniref:Uncharacterized protein n=1 Tax=Mytilus coruscus TaxID=42192 RepID=A0A6J8B2Y2_MYTCO|nr:unnamed protein product [Mytilus coruscus]